MLEIAGKVYVFFFHGGTSIEFNWRWWWRQKVGKKTATKSVAASTASASLWHRFGGQLKVDTFFRKNFFPFFSLVNFYARVPSLPNFPFLSKRSSRVSHKRSVYVASKRLMLGLPIMPQPAVLKDDFFCSLDFTWNQFLEFYRVSNLSIFWSLVLKTLKLIKDMTLKMWNTLFKSFA